MSPLSLSYISPFLKNVTSSYHLKNFPSRPFHLSIAEYIVEFKSVSRKTIGMSSSKKIEGKQMGKHFQNGCEQTLGRETLVSRRYSDTLQEALRSLIPLWSESCWEQGLGQWLPVMPPNPNYSESGRWSALQPPESQKTLVWLPGPPLGKLRMESTDWGSTCLRHRSLVCFWCCQAEQPLVQFNTGIQRHAIPELVQITQMLGSCSDTRWATVLLL